MDLPLSSSPICPVAHWAPLLGCPKDSTCPESELETFPQAGTCVVALNTSSPSLLHSQPTATDGSFYLLNNFSHLYTSLCLHCHHPGLTYCRFSLGPCKNPSCPLRLSTSNPWPQSSQNINTAMYPTPHSPRRTRMVSIALPASSRTCCPAWSGPADALAHCASALLAFSWFLEYTRLLPFPGPLHMPLSLSR